MKKLVLEPIVISEGKNKKLYDVFIGGGSGPEKLLCDAVEEALRIMLGRGLTMLPERKAVWYRKKVFIGKTLTGSYLRKIGVSFPTPEFGESCLVACQEKVGRTENNPEELCSHESRNPLKKAWEGSAKIKIRLLSAEGKVYEMTLIGAPSGLKGWEDLILELLPYYLLGLADLDNSQFKEILRRADESVKDDPTARLEGMTITAYAKMVFRAVGRQLAKNR